MSDICDDCNGAVILPEAGALIALKNKDRKHVCQQCFVKKYQKSKKLAFAMPVCFENKESAMKLFSPFAKVKDYHGNIRCTHCNKNITNKDLEDMESMTVSELRELSKGCTNCLKIYFDALVPGKTRDSILNPKIPFEYMNFDKRIRLGIFYPKTFEIRFANSEELTELKKGGWKPTRP